ncbi:MAG TPA: pre-toxin TG domain-containing protein [Opitutales bacterium]|nr:pre-toxin TG domain-containing protein [Opitutales bacterium]
MGTRYYNSDTARFISPDPYGHAGSIDLYSYANGNPVKYCDPDGRHASTMRDAETNILREAASFAGDWLPVVGNIKSGIEAFTGKDFITGKKLSTGERWIAGVGTVLPMVKGHPRFSKGQKRS